MSNDSATDIRHRGGGVAHQYPFRWRSSATSVVGMHASRKSPSSAAELGGSQVSVVVHIKESMATAERNAAWLMS